MASLGAAIHLCKSRASILGLLGAASLMSFAVLPEKAAAFTPVFTLPNPPNALTVDSTIRVFGFHFTTSIDRQVRSVGIYSPTATDHTIGIWDFSLPTPSLIYQQQVPVANGCNLYESYCWVNIPSTNLSASKDYVIASTWGASEPFPFQLNTTVGIPTVNVASFSLDNTARIVSGQPLPPTFLVDLTPYVPTGTSGFDDKGYYTVNLSFDTFSPSPSQVPAPLPLFGAAAAFGMSRKIRRRISAAS
jgi:hypothetical protein